jgi:carotenoid cleavage dioxygenase-like enzyme
MSAPRLPFIDPDRRQMLLGATAFGLMGQFQPAWADPGSTRSPAQAPVRDWRLGVANAPAEGFAEAPLRLIYGKVPADFSGTLYRNGPGWFRYGDDVTGHWFDGDGMIQRFSLSSERATHSGRFVATEKRRIEQERQQIVMPGFGTHGRPDAPVMSSDDVNAANTALLDVGDRLWALWEGGSPYSVDSHTLATHGPVTLRDDLKGMPFLAHPKVEPDGTIWSLGMIGRRAMIYRLDPRGQLLEAQMITLPMAGYAHDWAVSERHLILPLQPWVAQSSTPPFVDTLVWKPEEGMKVLVIEKADLTRSRVFELPARAFFHTGDAWEATDGSITFDVCLTDDPSFGAQYAKDLVRGIAPPTAEKPLLALVTLKSDGTASLVETSIGAEFPQTDKRRQGKARDLVIAVHEGERETFGPDGWLVHNWRTGKTDRFRLADHQIAEEPLFVPRPGGSDENDGWVVAPALNWKAGATEVWLFDVRDMSGGPQAVWQAPRALPLGFHGLFRQA